MTENIPQTSASERYEAARILLAAWDEAATPDANGCHDAGGFASRENARIRQLLRALITPPGVGYSEEEIADTIMLTAPLDARTSELVILGVRAAIQAAHETWEPADVPSQEFMLRHLGIQHEPSYREGHIYIEPQHIETEVI